MQSVIHDFRKFYSSDIGLIAKDIISLRIREFWPDLRGLRVGGFGYAAPYLDVFCCDKPERVCAMMPVALGIASWPVGDKNSSFLCEEGRVPLENASVDRILLMHYLENCADINAALREVWRVLKPNGRLLVVVPNRMGAWAHAEWSPFGQGTPYTISQLCSVLQASQFIHENHKGGLFMLPIPDSPVMMKASRVIERMGNTFLPFVAGVHIVEFSKQIYARADQGGSGSAVVTKTKQMLGAKPAVAPQNFKASRCRADRLDQHHP